MYRDMRTAQVDFQGSLNTLTHIVNAMAHGVTRLSNTMTAMAQRFTALETNMGLTDDHPCGNLDARVNTLSQMLAHINQQLNNLVMNDEPARYGSRRFPHWGERASPYFASSSGKGALSSDKGNGKSIKGKSV